MKWQIFILFVLVIPFAYSKEIVMSTNQSEYYFQVGQDAFINIEVDNEYGKDIDGILSYTITQQMNVGGFYSSQTSSKSTNALIDKDSAPLQLGFGTSNTPLDITLKSLTFSFSEPGNGKQMISEINDIVIHFVQDPSQQNNQQQGKQSQQSGQQSQQQQKPAEPKKEDAASKIQNQQQSQDMNSLKNQMQKEAQEHGRQEEEFRKNLESNQDLAREHQKMMQKGYNQSGSNYFAKDNNTGNFEIEYEKDGVKEKIKGKVENGTVQNMTNSLDMKKHLEENKEYQELKKQLEKKGFKPKEFDGNQNEFSQEFRDQFNNSVKLDGNGNFSDMKIDVEERLSDGFILDKLSKDKKYSRIKDKLEAGGYEQSGVGDGHVRFVKDDKEKNVFFEKPQIIENKKTVWDYFKLGWSFLFDRT